MSIYGLYEFVTLTSFRTFYKGTENLDRKKKWVKRVQWEDTFFQKS